MRNAPLIADNTPKRVPWWGTALAVTGIALTVALGFWQLGRAETKRALQARLDEHAKQAPLTLTGRETEAQALLLHRVQATGRYDPARMVLLDNRVYQGRAGFHVIMPLMIAGGRPVLVNRGWVGHDGVRSKLPQVTTPAGEVPVRGVAVEGATRYVALSTHGTEGNIWQNLVLERYRQATKLDVLPFVVQQDGADALSDGLTRDWPPLDLRRNTNLAYAVQWFALALVIFTYITVLHVRARRFPRS